MIKLIAIDLDGTLLKDDKTISDRNKEILTNILRNHKSNFLSTDFIL